MSVALHSDSADDVLRENRQRDIENMQRTSERLTAAAINRSTKRHPHAAKLALRGLSKGLANLDYQGNGAWSSVYRSREHVIKVLRNTAQMTEQERQQFAQERNEMCSRAATVLGSLLVPQDYMTGVHPFGDYDVVIARQDYIPGPSLDLFRTNSTELCASQIADFCETTAKGQAQLEDLVASTFVLHDQQATVPDLNGVDNIRIDPNQTMRLIDAEPIAYAEHPAVHELILSQAEILGAYLGKL